MSAAARPVDADVLHRAVEAAALAPSVHNTQPWRWRTSAEAVELHADRERRLVASDPDDRDLLVSCGAALHHLRAALAGLGVATRTERFPDPDHRWHLATVRPAARPPDRVDAVLAEQVPRRRTDRRRCTDRAVGTSILDDLVRAGAREGAVVVPVTERRARARLVEVLAAAVAELSAVPGRAAETAAWTQRYAGAGDGVPAAVLPREGTGAGGPLLQRFPAGLLEGGVQRHDLDAGELLVVATADDTDVDRLRAGEAVSAVLLTATRHDLAALPLSSVLEAPRARERLRRDLPHATQPQLLVRVGWPPAGAPPLPPVPRRHVADVERRS